MGRRPVISDVTSLFASTETGQQFYSLVFSRRAGACEIARKMTMVTPHSKTISNMVGSLVLALFSNQLLAQDILELDDMVVTAGLQPISINYVASSLTIITRA